MVVEYNQLIFQNWKYFVVFIKQKFSALDMTVDDKVDPNVVLNEHDRLSRDTNWLLLMF